MNQTPTQKCHHFNRDLDKLLSGQYVLAPLTATDAMRQQAERYLHCTSYATDPHTLIDNLWRVMIGQLLHENTHENIQEQA